MNFAKGWGKVKGIGTALLWGRDFCSSCSELAASLCCFLLLSRQGDGGNSSCRLSSSPRAWKPPSCPSLQHTKRQKGSRHRPRNQKGPLTLPGSPLRDLTSVSAEVGLSCIFLLPSRYPTSPPNSSPAETSAWLKPPPRLGAVPRCCLCVGKTLQESQAAGQRAGEDRRRLPAGGVQGGARCS